MPITRLLKSTKFRTTPKNFTSTPKKIIYVSCNPKTLAFDLAALRGYAVSYIRAFDQFPQTMHIELLCVLEKIEAA